MQKIKKGFIKNIVSALLAVTLMFPITLFAGCGLKSSDYTEKEHLKRVSERVEKRYFADDGKYEYTDYEIYPVYDENDDLAYFVVDFQPCDFIYVTLGDVGYGCGGFIDMYSRSTNEPNQKWSRYKIPDNASHDSYYNERIWECDESGNIIEYNVSHYKAANIENEKRYLLYVKQNNGSIAGFIPAVKRGGKFFNLVSMDEMHYQRELDDIKYSISDIMFRPYAEFNL